MPLEGVDVLEALAPEMLLGRGAFALEQLAMNAHDHDVLVVGPVEDRDASAFGQHARGAPQEIVRVFFGAGLLETVHVDALRVHAGHHVLHCAVFAGRIHALQHDQQRVRAHRREHVLQLREARDVVLQLPGRVALALEAAGCGGIVVAQPQAMTGRHPECFVFHESNARKPSSSSTAMPSASAFASFVPASSPATT